MQRCHTSTGVRISCRLELEKSRGEDAEIGELPPLDSNCLLPVTRLKTLVPWAKSAKLGTFARKPFLSRHDL
jgi:hypothetical protein